MSFGKNGGGVAMWSVGSDIQSSIGDEKSRPSRSSEKRKIEYVDNGAAFQHRWSSNLIQPRIVSGLLALGCTIVCMLAALGVLVASDQRPVHTWRVQPTVPLAILSAIGAGALRYAKGRANPVAWWYKAIQGRTVRQLEDQWQAGGGFLNAMTRLRHGGFISMATLLTTVMIIDGAMLQRASSVRLATLSHNITLQIPLSPEVPYGASGTEQAQSLEPTSFSFQISKDAIHHRPMLAAVRGCPTGSTCQGTVWGPGAAISTCQSKTQVITKEMLYDPKAQWGLFHGPQNTKTVTGENATWYYNSIFDIIIYSLVDSDTDVTFEGNKRSINPRQADLMRGNCSNTREAAVVYTGIANWNASGGAYVERQCVLEPAVLEYDIEVTNGELTIPSGSSAGRFVAFANNTKISSTTDQKSIKATITDFTSTLSMLYTANATAILWQGAPAGVDWIIYPNSFSAGVAKYFGFKDGLGVTFLDPWSDIMSSLNSMTFRAGLAAANWPKIKDLIDPGLDPLQTIPATRSVTENIYVSDFRWFAGAAVLDILAVLVVLPLFWGWWTLPKHLSRNSPFDMALAFGSPMFSGPHSPAGSAEVVDRFGETRIAYEIVRNEGRFKSERLTSAVARDAVPASELDRQLSGITRTDGIARPRTGEVRAV